MRADVTPRRARLLSRDQHPHEVARHAARIAGRVASDPDTRLLVMQALSPYMGDERDTRGSSWPVVLHRWARSIRHVREPAAVGELLVLPARVVAYRAGDCDDIALAVASFAAHVGLPAGIMSLWTGPASAHHVAVVGVGWYGADAARLPDRVVDPDAPGVASTMDAPYRFGRVFPVSVAR